MRQDIQDFLAYMEIHKGASASTLACYRRDMDRALSFFEEQGVADSNAISQTNLRSYLLSLEKDKLSAATVSRNLASLRSFFRFLLISKRIENDPSEGLTSPRVERKRTDILSKKQIETLLKQPDLSTLKGIRDRTMLELFCSLGLGIGQLLGLKTGDLDLKAGCLYIEDKNRAFLLGDEAKHMLQLYLGKARMPLMQGRMGDHLFCNYQGRPMSRQGFWKMLKAYAESAGIDQAITPHSLKYSLTLQQIREGDFSGQLAPEVIRQLLG